jgi:hypothetical protein
VKDVPTRFTGVAAVVDIVSIDVPESALLATVTIVGENDAVAPVGSTVVIDKATSKLPATPWPAAALFTVTV